jgi:Transglycosylase SLT domain/Peptidase family M23
MGRAPYGLALQGVPCSDGDGNGYAPVRNLRRLCALLLLTVAVAATVLTTSASADEYMVTVRLDDGTLITVIADLPPGATLTDAAASPDMPGTPVALEPHSEPPPAPPPAPAPPGEPDAGPAPAPGGGTPDRDEPPEPPGADRTHEKKLPDSGGEDTDGTKEPRAERLGDEADAEAYQRPAKKLTAQRDPSSGERLRKPDGSPTRSNPGFVDVLPGPSSATGVPNFIIRKFRVPPFLLSIYQAAGVEYSVRWEVLAAINEIETDYGRNLNVSSAGAVGWMQFLPSSWKRYGVDANQDGRKDPYNPVDAIFAAARYLDAAGYSDDPRGAIFAYNHADWYVDSVMLRSRLIAAVPSDLIGSLTGLTEARFPVKGPATYADDIAEQQLLKRVGRGENAAHLIESSEARSSIDIFADRGAQVVAVNDGVIKRVAHWKRGDALVLQDVYGNRYTYARLGRVSRRLEAGKRVRSGAVIARVGRSRDDAAPHLRFSIRPSGRGAPSIDPKPILDGWQLLEATEIYRANGTNVLRDGPTVGQILLMSKPLLQKRVLADSRIDIYPCGRADIAAGRIDRRVLATLEYLAESGLSPTVTSLRCGHSYMTKSGNVSEHASGNAVDIAKINGVPILGHQEAGGVADQAVRRLMLLQGTMVPHQVISLLELGGPTMAMSDHADHVHVGFQPAGEAWRRAGYSVLTPSQWPKLMSRLNVLENPIVP